MKLTNRATRALCLLSVAATISGRATECWDATMVVCHRATGPITVTRQGIDYVLTTTEGRVPSCVPGSTYKTVENYIATCCWNEHWGHPLFPFDETNCSSVNAKNCYDKCDNG